MLTPEAPLKELPDRPTVPELLTVTEEFPAATAVFSSPAAVTWSIWLSRSSWVLVCFLSDDLDLLWPYACPETTKAATRVDVVTRFFTSASTAWLTQFHRLRGRCRIVGRLTPAGPPFADREQTSPIDFSPEGASENGRQSEKPHTAGSLRWGSSVRIDQEPG